MTRAVDDLRAALAADFADSRTQLIEARRRHQQKDTPANRSSVAECRARIDRVLDLYLDVFRGASG